MSIRNLFDGQGPTEVFSETPENIRKDGESLENVRETWENRKRFIPQVDFANPEINRQFGRYSIRYGQHKGNRNVFRCQRKLF